MNPLPSPLLAVTDRTLCSVPLERQVERIFDGGVKWLWLRDKDLPYADRKALAARLMTLSETHGAIVSIGGDIELALDAGASAAHVSTSQDVDEARKRMGEAALIGMSAHAIPELATARSAGADYVTLSPIYPTSSKPGYGPALGLPAIVDGARYGIPVIALGGVTLERVPDVRNAGAAGAAMMGAIMQSVEPEQLVQKFFACWKQT